MEQLSGSENAILGTMAGAIEVCCNQPILYWKNASQQSLPFTLNPRYLYRGLLASVTNMAVLTGIQFFGAGKLRSLLVENENDKLNAQQILISAFGGGALSGLACGPMELIMIQQQRHGGSLFNTTYKIVSEFGVYNGIFRGLTNAIGREGIFTAGYLGVAPLIEDELLRLRNENSKNNANDNSFVNKIMYNRYFGQIGAASIAGLLASALSHPMDTIKTCMQGDIEQTQYKNVRQTLNELYTNQGGIKRMYRGFGWRYVRMALSVFIILRVKEHIAPIMYPQYFVNDENEKESNATGTEFVA